MATLNLTPREQELLIAVVAVMQANIDWNAVAPKANFTTAKQARDKWATVRTKIAAAVGGVEEGSTPTKKKATPKKRKNEYEETLTPSKKKTTTQLKKSSVAATEDDDDEELMGLIKPDVKTEEESFA